MSAGGARERFLSVICGEANKYVPSFGWVPVDASIRMRLSDFGRTYSTKPAALSESFEA